MIHTNVELSEFSYTLLVELDKISEKFKLEENQKCEIIQKVVALKRNIQKILLHDSDSMFCRFEFFKYSLIFERNISRTIIL